MDCFRRIRRALRCLLLCFLLPGLCPKAMAEPGASLALAGGEELDWVCGVPFADPGFSARDAAGQDCTAAVRVSGMVRPWFVGDYTLTYKLSLHGGESLTAYRSVHVRPGETVLPEPVPAEKTIYLTFDDGPSDYTEDVLAILARYDIKATFFIVASRSRCGELLPRIVEEGHTLGIHCYEHNVAELYKRWDNYFSDLMHAQETVHEITGAYAQIVRLPGGSRSAAPLIGSLEGRQAEFEEIMHTMGLHYFDWNIQPESHTQYSDSEFYAFSHPEEPYDSVVVLLHDTRQYSVLALERMIQWALDEGYRFAPLTLTTPEVHTQLSFW